MHSCQAFSQVKSETTLAMISLISEIGDHFEGKSKSGALPAGNFIGRGCRAEAQARGAALAAAERSSRSASTVGSGSRFGS